MGSKYASVSLFVSRFFTNHFIATKTKSNFSALCPFFCVWRIKHPKIYMHLFLRISLESWFFRIVLKGWLDEGFSKPCQICKMELFRHCVKRVQIWSSDLYFSVFGLNTGKYGPKKTPYLCTFHSVRKIVKEWKPLTFFAKKPILNLTGLLIHLWMLLCATKKQFYSQS